MTYSGRFMWWWKCLPDSYSHPC